LEPKKICIFFPVNFISFTQIIFGKVIELFIFNTNNSSKLINMKALLCCSNQAPNQCHPKIKLLQLLTGAPIHLQM